jgi:hypothetical protein
MQMCLCFKNYFVPFANPVPIIRYFSLYQTFVYLWMSAQKCFVQVCLGFSSYFAPFISPAPSQRAEMNSGGPWDLILAIYISHRCMVLNSTSFSANLHSERKGSEQGRWLLPL